MTKVKVLFVCLGNICRSPLAEAIFNHKISAMGLQNAVEAASCGTANYHVGDSPDHRTIANARKNGVTINHIGQQLSTHHLADYDFILAMDKSNHQNIVRLHDAEKHLSKISLMRSFDTTRESDEVPDPYYGHDRDFQQVFEILDQSVESFIEFLRKEHLKSFRP
jgi:protein-tyrosine phosphatase